MLTTKEKGLLEYVVTYCERIKELLEGVTKEDFDNSKNTRELICFNLMQIGELVAIFEDSFLAEHNKIPWKRIKGMRNVVVHRYGTIDMNVVWNTATKDIGPLEEYCKEILVQG